MTLYVAVLTSVMALCYADTMNLSTVAIGTYTVQFLSEIINDRDDVFSLHFSHSFTLSVRVSLGV